MNRRLTQWIGTIAFGALAFGAQACVIRESPGVNRGYGYGYAQAGYQGGVMVGSPSPYYVNSMPPEALYETMTSSPGYGYVWIDGYWHWNGYEWVWMSGRWVTEQTGYVYIQPYYDYDSGGSYVYYPGHWSRPEQVDSRVRVREHRDGRPTTGYYPHDDRAQSRDHRGTTGGGTVPPPSHNGGGSTTDHRGDGGGTTTVPPSSHDHRDNGGGTTTTPPPRDHRNDGDTVPPPPPKHDGSNDHRGTTTRAPRHPDSNDVKPPPPSTKRDNRGSSGSGSTSKPPPRKPSSNNVKPSPAPSKKAPATKSPPKSHSNGSTDHRHHSSIQGEAPKTLPAVKTEMAAGIQVAMLTGKR